REPVLYPERLRQQILGVIEDAAGVAVRAEIGHRHAQMDLRGRADPELRHAADHPGNGGRFAHREDARRVEQPAGLGNVDVGYVRSALANHLHGAARIADALVGHQRHADFPSYLRHATEIVGGQRLLHQLDIIGFHGTDHADRVLRRGPSHVAVDAKLDIRSDRFAHEAHGGKIGRRLIANLDLDRPVAGAHALARELRHRGRLAERHRVAERDAVPDLSAELIIDRRAEGLADDVPEGHLDAGLGFFHAIERLVHFLNEIGDPERVLADHHRYQSAIKILTQQGAAPLEDTGHFADAGNAGVGFHEHDGVVRNRRRSERGTRDAAECAPPGAPHRDRAHLGDLHLAALLQTSVDQVFGTLYEFPDDVQSPMTRSWPKPIIQSLPDQVAQTILKRIATGEL